MKINEIDRRGFLKGTAALATAGAVGYGAGKPKNVPQKRIPPDGLDENPDPEYVWWYCGAMQAWLTSRQKDIFGKFKPPGIHVDNKLQGRAWRDSAMYLTRAMEIYGASSPEINQVLHDRASLALTKLLELDKLK